MKVFVRKDWDVIIAYAAKRSFSCLKFKYINSKFAYTVLGFELVKNSVF